MEKRLNGFTPTKLRMALIGSLFLSLVIAAAGYWFFLTQLTAYADQVSIATAEADQSSSDAITLQRLKKELEDDKIAVNRAKSIVADSKFYQYQDQIIKDINAYAKASGVTVSAYDFGTSAGASGGAAAGTAPAPTAPTTPTATGLKSTKVTVSLNNPVDYKSAMRFIYAIEQNLTKMQLSGISLAAGDNENEVTVNALNIEVYIR